MEVSPSRRYKKTLVFPMCKHSRTLPIVQPANLSQPNYGATYENRTFLHPTYIETYKLPFLQGFYKGKCNFFSQEKFFSLLSLGTQATDPSEGNI
jgi:hypothetical protein